MNWYAKHGATGVIVGPMSKEVALAKVDEVDILVFNEEIFEPKFAITEEVEGVLANLRDLKEGQPTAGYWADKGGIAKICCQQAIDTIILLSREKPEVPLDLSDCDATTGALVSELNCLRTSMQIVRNGENDAIGKMLLRCIERFKLFSDDASIASLVSDLIKTAKFLDDQHETELNAVAEPWSEPPGRLLERATTALLLLSSKVQNIPPLEQVAQDRLLRDLKECDCCRSLCHRAVQAIQAVT